MSVASAQAQTSTSTVNVNSNVVIVWEPIDRQCGAIGGAFAKRCRKGNFFFSRFSSFGRAARPISGEPLMIGDRHWAVLWSNVLALTLLAPVRAPAPPGTWRLAPFVKPVSLAPAHTSSGRSALFCKPSLSLSAAQRCVLAASAFRQPALRTDALPFSSHFLRNKQQPALPRTLTGRWPAVRRWTTMTGLFRAATGPSMCVQTVGRCSSPLEFRILIAASAELPARADGQRRQSAG